MENSKDKQEMLALTFWETRQDMDAFYQQDNKALAEFIKNTQLLEQPPQRTDYEVVKFII